MKYALAKALVGRVGVSLVCIGAGHYCYTTFLEPLVAPTTHPTSPTIDQRLFSTPIAKPAPSPFTDEAIAPMRASERDLPSRIEEFLREARYAPR